MGLLQKAGEIPPVPCENSFVSSKKQGMSKHAEQYIITSSWKPADIFSTLGERERDKTLIEAKKSQWKKELDEQVALKKKLLTLEMESKYHPCHKMDVVKSCSKTVQTPHQTKVGYSTDFSPAPEDLHSSRTVTTEPREPTSSVSSSQIGQFSTFSSPDLPSAIRTSFVLGEATPLEQPFNAVKREQQKKWLEELDKQKEADRLRKLEEKRNLSKGEEHDKWTMHFDSFRNNSSSQNLSHTIHKKQPESSHLSPEPQEQTAFTPAEVESIGEATGNNILEPNQKPSFLRSMTALLDPAQLEERERRRQKQLEHQKAIMAQVEEKRKKKQLEEEQRKQEEQEEERRLAKEQELMKKQFEDDLLKQKQKEEMMTLKTNELYQTMQRAQELAQKLKQEQRIKELAQKGHDTSKLQKNLSGGDVPCSCSTDLNGVFEIADHCFRDSSIVNQDAKKNLSPQKDIAVQTDGLNTDIHPNADICTKQDGKGRTDCESPDIATEYKVDLNTKRCKNEPQYLDKQKILEKENIVSDSNLCEQTSERHKQIKKMERSGKRPDWNINKPCKRYIPASEKYPRHLQKQREEKKARRKMELLQLVERNSPGNLSQTKGVSSDRAPSTQHEYDDKHKEELSIKNNVIEQRSESPPVPAVKNRLQQQIKAPGFPTHNSSNESEKTTCADKQSERPPSNVENERPPSSHFVPYVRTNEVYYLDPDAPMTRPSTHDPQSRELNDAFQAPRQIFSSDHIRDPLFNPNVVRDRQQAILKGLSELRQGLLQKQRELETCLIPTMLSQEENFISLF
uniref:Coiled-coil domain containing 66 n=1 Tax=Salvator merianae TaxID=96440 RepID=A0A8D0E7I4_SALMN